ncbi:MAG TPA: hypothetical protein VIW22_06760, partial [Nitrososphaerales archaeon]
SSTLFSGLSTTSITGSSTSISNVFSVAAGTVPVSGYVKVTLTAPAYSSFTIKWGSGQPTDFQVTYTYRST